MISDPLHRYLQIKLEAQSSRICILVRHMMLFTVLQNHIRTCSIGFLRYLAAVYALTKSRDILTEFLLVLVAFQFRKV